MQEPSALYKRLVDLNGTYQNKLLRTLSDADLETLRQFASTQEPLPFTSPPTNNIELSVRREQRRRS